MSAGMSSLAGAITPEQHAAIKERIQAHLRDQGVFNDLKAIVTSALDSDGQAADHSDVDHSALTAAQRASVLARIVADQAGAATPHPITTDSRQHQRLLLHVLLLGGRAFAHEGLTVDNDDASGDRGTVCACLQFGAQRFRSQSVPFCAEPKLSDGVLLELPLPDAAATAAIGAAGVPSMAMLETLRALCRQCEPIHVLVLHTVRGRERLLSSCMLEWRQVLHHGRQTLSIELPGVGAEATLPVGALELKLELLPRPKAEACMTEAEVMLSLKRERDTQVEAERRFFAYARAWWAQYVEMSPTHATRAVKLFALSELGTQRPVSAFVRPLPAARLLPTPRHAAHFVALLRHRRDPAAGAAATDVWRTAHATLATQSGETEEHALLLCSLLLGFGLEAYVCLGADGRGSHAFVLTRSLDGALTFWESLSGASYPLPGPHPYTELACVFNHRALYANTQASCSLEHASLDLADPSAWKPMDAALMQAITPLPMTKLRPSTLGDVVALEEAREAQLRALVDVHRAGLGLAAPGVRWDDELAERLAPALAAYETERRTGHAAIDNALFADAIRRKVSSGFTFKGFPHHFVTSEAEPILRAWLRDEVALSILQCRASKASLAVRLQIHPMPEDVVSVWAMLAIAYRPED